MCMCIGDVRKVDVVNTGRVPSSSNKSSERQQDMVVASPVATVSNSVNPQERALAFQENKQGRSGKSFALVKDVLGHGSKEEAPVTLEYPHGPTVPSCHSTVGKITHDATPDRLNVRLYTPGDDIATLQVEIIDDTSVNMDKLFESLEGSDFKSQNNISSSKSQGDASSVSQTDHPIASKLAPGSPKRKLAEPEGAKKKLKCTQTGDLRFF